MTKQEISDLFDKYEDGYQAWRGNGVMTKGAFTEAVTEALRIHAVSGRSEQLVCEHPDEAIIRDKPTDYCLACNRNI